MNRGFARARAVRGWLALCYALVALLTLAVVARAADNSGNKGGKEEKYGRIAAIAVPATATPPCASASATLTAFDISWVEPKLGKEGTYLLADRTNCGLDAFDAATNLFSFRVGGFVGAAATCATGSAFDCSGPNGVVTVKPDEAWVGDGDSTVKVVDLSSKSITDTISTGGKFRADEEAFDPRDNLVAIANDADAPPFLTFISTETGHKILGSLSFPDATGGLEQPQWWSQTGLIYIPVPEINHTGKGEIAVVDPSGTPFKVVDAFPLDCQPAGLTIGPENFALVGCSDGPVEEINLRSGARVHTFTEVGFADEVWFEPGSGHYFVAAGSNVVKGSPDPVLGILDAQSKKFDQNIKTAVGDHSVAADSENGHVFLPSAPIATDMQCTMGCVLVFACRSQQVGQDHPGNGNGNGDGDGHGEGQGDGDGNGEGNGNGHGHGHGLAACEEPGQGD